MKYLVGIEQGYVKVPIACVGELKQEGKALFYLHGNDTSIERQEVPAALLYEATGVPIILPEYSGHGDNVMAQYEETTPAMHMLEVFAAYDWLCGQVGEENIIVYGTSYGGMLAAAVMKWRAPRRVILFAPTFIQEDKLYTKLKKGAALSPFVNGQTQAEVADIIFRATGGHGADLMIMKAEHDASVALHVVDAWKDVYQDACLVTLKNAQHSIRQSSQDARNEWARVMGEFITAED